MTLPKIVAQNRAPFPAAFLGRRENASEHRLHAEQWEEIRRYAGRPHPLGSVAGPKQECLAYVRRHVRKAMTPRLPICEVQKRHAVLVEFARRIAVEEHGEP